MPRRYRAGRIDAPGPEPKIRNLATKLTLLALFAAACGGGSSESTTTTAPQATTTTAAAPTTTGVVTTTTAASTTTSAATTTVAAAPTWASFLTAGVCLQGEEFDFNEPPEVVDCDAPHDNEILSVFAFGSEGDPYPGDDVIDQASGDQCLSDFRDFVSGRDIELTDLFEWWVVPDESDWSAGDRDIVCGVSSFNGQMKGTAASGTLSGDGYTMAVLTQVDDQFDLELLQGPFGEYVFTLTADAAEERTSKPAWSPDGASIVYGAIVEGQAGLYRVAADGSATPELIFDEPGENDSPQLSPDGSTVVFVSDRADSGELDLFLLDLDSGVATRLTDNADRDSSASFSPDGTQIVFRGRVDGNSDVYVIGVDGSGLTRLTDDPAFDGDPTWTPDGRIVFLTERTGDYEIFVMEADGSGQTNLTNHPANDEYPDVSPDGQLISFHSDRHGGTTVWLMEPDGSNQTVFGWFSPTGYGSFAP